MKMKSRKQREAPPPSEWIRSLNGVPARLCRTSLISEADEWLYRLDYGTAKGTQLWSVLDLERAGVEWLPRQPDDWELSEWRMRSEVSTDES